MLSKFWKEAQQEYKISGDSLSRWEEIIKQYSTQPNPFSDYTAEKIKEIGRQIILPIQRQALNAMFEYAGLFAEKGKIDQSSSSQEIQDIQIFHLALEKVLKGEEKEAKKMIEQYPELLSMRGNITYELTGRQIFDVTLFELAYGADDVEMCRMILQHIPDEQKETVFKQIDEKFPEEKKEEKEYDFTPIVKAITEYKKEDAESQKNTQETIFRFMADFDPAIIRKGKHFNIQDLCNAMNVYNKNYDAWSHDQRSLFWCQVVGFLQFLLPTCYAQAFAQGLYGIVEKGRPLERNLKYGYYGPTNFYNNKLGIDHAVSVGRSSETDMDTVAPRPFGPMLDKYAEKKHEDLLVLNPSYKISNRPKHS